MSRNGHHPKACFRHKVLREIGKIKLHAKIEEGWHQKDGFGRRLQKGMRFTSCMLNECKSGTYSKGDSGCRVPKRMRKNKLHLECQKEALCSCGRRWVECIERRAPDCSLPSKTPNHSLEAPQKPCSSASKDAAFERQSRELCTEQLLKHLRNRICSSLRAH